MKSESCVFKLICFISNHRTKSVWLKFDQVWSSGVGAKHINKYIILLLLDKLLDKRGFCSCFSSPIKKTTSHTAAASFSFSVFASAPCKQKSFVHCETKVAWMRDLWQTSYCGWKLNLTALLQFFWTSPHWFDFLPMTDVSVTSNPVKLCSLQGL